jgi:hypothetical protein
MATTTNLTSSFVGEAATELINKMFFGAKSIADGTLTIKDDVNKAYHIRRLAGSGLVATPTCDFTPAGTMTIDENVLTITPFEVNLQLCKNDFKHVDWSSERMGGGNGRKLSQDVVDAMIAEILGNVGDEIEMHIWRGNTASGSYQLMDGFFKKFAADATVLDGTAGAITSSVVIEDLAELYGLIAATPVIDAPDLQFYVAPNVAAAYKQALAALGYMDQYSAGDKPLNYLGTPIVVTPGLEASQMVLTHKSNLYFGTESVSALNEVSLKDMGEVDLSENVRFKALASMGVQYGWGSEVAIHAAS